MSDEKTNNTLIKYSLISLLNSKEIKDIRIPVIQRDFAYGREEEKEKRDNLLNKLYAHLKSEPQNPYILDFVYGKVDSVKNFYPVDGQQRLTTLYLLHLYLAKKDKTAEDFSKLTYLKKFHYESRRNSEDFFSYLISENIDFKNENIKSIIENRSWFRNIWKNDATVSAILIMLQSIHEKFKNTKNWYNKLEESIDKTISFYFLDLGKKEFELTDELYIKMNARGKQLSRFENFKASFIDFLDEIYPSKKDEFTHKIESDWTNLFWGYRTDEEHFDEKMLNFFDVFSALSFFKNHPDAKSEDYNIKNLKDNFLKEDDINLLYSSLDWLYKISEKNNNNEVIVKKEKFEGKIEFFLKNVFSESTIKLFWDEKANIFVDILNKGIETETRSLILFYQLLVYVTKHNLTDVTSELCNYLRLIRNLLSAIIQLSEVRYNTNIRLNYFGNYSKLFSQLDESYSDIENKCIDLTETRMKDAFENELEKIRLINENKVSLKIIYELENLSLFEGLLHNLNLIEHYKHAESYLYSIKEIWSNPDNSKLINMAMVACNFTGLYVRNCNNGAWENYYFGNCYNWHSVTIYNKDNQIKETLHTLLEKYLIANGNSPKEKLISIIQSGISSYKTNQWQYYFLKYSDIFCIPDYMNYFAWISKNFEIESLKNASSNPSNGKHINPFIYLVYKQINDESICKLESCKIQHGYVSKLIFVNGTEILCKENGWKIRKQSISNYNLIEKYKMIDDDNYYIFKENEEFDRIQICYQFVKDFLQL